MISHVNIIASSIEEEVIQSVARQLWFGDDKAQATDLPSPLSQSDLLQHLTPLHRDRLHRLLARALLYCGRYDDTQVLASISHPSYYIITIPMIHVVGSDLPLGHTPGPSGSPMVPCTRLAILFHWASSNSKWQDSNLAR